MSVKRDDFRDVFIRLFTLALHSCYPFISVHHDAALRARTSVYVEITKPIYFPPFRTNNIPARKYLKAF